MMSEDGQAVTSDLAFQALTHGEIQTPQQMTDQVDALTLTDVAAVSCLPSNSILYFLSIYCDASQIFGVRSPHEVRIAFHTIPVAIFSLSGQI